MAPSSFRARSPLLLSVDGSSNSSLSTVEHLPTTTEQLICQWHMVASSSSFWTAGKHDVSVVYEDNTTTQSKSPPGTLNDIASYYSGSPPTQQHSTRGISSPSASASGVYNWRGVGWLRMVTTRWEIVGFGSLLGSNGTDLLVTFAQKTIFSPQSLSIYCREKPQVSDDEVIQRVSDVLKQMGNAALSDEVDRLQAIP
ncbi:hypothetical protein F4809DRAFT_665268 [Biscogniauxia mediterranea]|nr:hypothetical protein F4809DRAFT_665268 [Biscogniauxia mediterranea]